MKNILFPQVPGPTALKQILLLFEPSAIVSCAGRAPTLVILPIYQRFPPFLKKPATAYAR